MPGHEILARCPHCHEPNHGGRERCYCGALLVQDEGAEIVNLATERLKRQPFQGWELLLDMSERSGIRRTLGNLLIILSYHEAWAGVGDEPSVLAYDEFRQEVIATRTPPVRELDRPAMAGKGRREWTETDTVRTMAWFGKAYGFEPSAMMLEQAIRTVAEQQLVHPVRDYLGGLCWDGTQRIPGFLSTYFGASRNAYTEAIGACWLISAVARVMQPGCKADSILVLEGLQGIGKSRALAALAVNPEWFSDTPIVIGDKDSYQALRGKWIQELAELASIKTARDVERVKAFASSRLDTYRPSYGRRTMDFPRQCVFAGSTNDSQYLADRTGNRRFWPVACSRADVDAIERDRDQLWAEALVRYRDGQVWHLRDQAVIHQAQEEQDERVLDDPWIPLVAAWLEEPVVWDPESPSNRRWVKVNQGVTTAEIAMGALGFRAANISRSDETRIGIIMRGFGFTTKRIGRHGKRVRTLFPPDGGSGQE